MASEARGGFTGLIGFQIFMLGLSIYAVVALLIDLVVALPPHASRMIYEDRGVGTLNCGPHGND